MRYSLLLSQYKSYWYDTFNYCPSANSTDMTQYTTVPLPVLLIYTFHYYPSTSLTYMTQSTIAPVPVLLIRHSPLLSMYYSFWYDTVYHCPLSATDTTAHVCPRRSPADMKQSTTAPVPDLLDTIVHYSTSTNPANAIQSTTDGLPNTSPTDTLQCATAQDQSYFCSSTSPASVPIPVLLIWYSPLLPQPKTNW